MNAGARRGGASASGEGAAFGEGAGAGLRGTPVAPDALRRERDARGEEGTGDDAAGLADDPRLDPMERRFAQLAPPFFAPPPPVAPSAAEAPSPVAAQAAASLESLLPAMVKKIAWSGDARRGTVRMELGAGALDGSTVLIHADHGEVSVHLSTPPGVDPTAWRERIQRRLEARGLRVTEVAID